TVGFAVLFSTFAFLKRRTALAELSSQLESVSLDRTFAVLHLLAMAVFTLLSWILYGDRFAALGPAAALLLWLAAGCAAIAFAAQALVPRHAWIEMLRGTSSIGALTLALIVAACIAGNPLRSLWNPAAAVTFWLAKAFLSPFASGLVADPATMILGTPRFAVYIAPACSGFEGVGLMLAFSLCWLWIFRRECRFPQALVLIPLGAVTIFLLNAARIAALILIGDAGAPQIALGGFHSQAGWLAFNAAALGFCVVATRVRWLRKPTSCQPATQLPPPDIAAAAPVSNPAMPYLLPFLAILAAAMIATALSSGFEWLYPLRLLAAAAVLWTLRSRYRSLDFRFTWCGPAIGVAVFLLWIAFASIHPSAASDAMPSALAAVSAPLRIGWITGRILAAVVTVPIAEELAFRAFLIRRIVSPDFDVLPPTTFTWPALLLSSVAFGLLHGHLWLPGILAGLLYAWAFLRRGRIGEAVSAHATTNALLAAYVLLTHHWHLW
ncbi:MAG TPA: exosortase E/protease, VPEID-CTERM system, partial [Acidobacteriaceae bacterium]|nr:exosortase E/protease, VPEID-CTERM system [Acidobacteriaceae bacterium]